MNKRVAPLVLALATACPGLFGCGAELERSSEVETLRVLGVHKSKSYARAGEQVTFSMLWHDPEGRDITPVWFALGIEDVLLMPLCVNPPRDTYSYCLPMHGVAFSERDAQDVPEEQRWLSQLLSLEGLSQRGDSITLTLPAATVDLDLDALGLDVKGADQFAPKLPVPSREALDAAGIQDFPLNCDEADTCDSMYHKAADAKHLPNFGSAFVFFALCPGTLRYDESVSQGFGLLCLDEDDEPLGPDDFVFGYSQVFLYADIENKNPVVEGMLVDGEEARACIGPQCLELDAERPQECGDGVVCLDVCTKDDEDDCPEVDIKPLLSQSDNQEPDEVAKLAYDRDVSEQMWIRYYTDQGRMDSEVKLLNDATTGWNSDFGTTLRLPQEPGPLRLWAVVYDNRGGQDWVQVDAVVQ